MLGDTPKLLCPPVFKDGRGELWVPFMGHSFVQQVCINTKGNVLRGLHVNITGVQGKLVSCQLGKVIVIAVDVRKGSKAFGNTTFEVLEGGGGTSYWVPPGHANGIFSLENSLVSYLSTAAYDQENEKVLSYREVPLPFLQWHGVIQVSDKDNAGGTLDEVSIS